MPELIADPSSLLRPKDPRPDQTNSASVTMLNDNQSNIDVSNTARHHNVYEVTSECQTIASDDIDENKSANDVSRRSVSPSPGSFNKI